MKRKIAVVTSSRADYAHLRWLLHDLEANPAADLQVITLGPHLSPAFGHTGKSVRTPKQCIIECLLDSDSDVGMAKTIGVATLGLADALSQMRPDILVRVADRYEMLGPASAALALRIPIAHVEGGEVTFGAIDDAVRNALTKMSHLHFACTRQAAHRIEALGEEPWRIKFSGSLSLDFLQRERLLGRSQVEKNIGFSLKKDAVLCLYHPVTLLNNTVEEAPEVFAALQARGGQVIFIYPNADAGSRELVRRAEAFAAAHVDSRLLTNLDHLTYTSLLSHVGVLVGNSSSGIIESTALEVPVVNIGIRQQGREHAANVINVKAGRTIILRAISQALSEDFRRGIRGLKSPYGEGKASQIISKTLLSASLGPKLLFKRAATA
ncbi:MAG: UDP-N-acetylglucosamine 2-epimerase [Terriglobales bacterium]